MAMTVEELAAKLKCVHKNAPEGKKAVRVHLFGIKYAAELADISIKELATLAGIPGLRRRSEQGAKLGGVRRHKAGRGLVRVKTAAANLATGNQAPSATSESPLRPVIPAKAGIQRRAQARLCARAIQPSANFFNRGMIGHDDDS